MAELSLPPTYRPAPLRVACVQFDPKLGKVAENMAKVTRMTASLRPHQLDLLVLPEMALSGYMFSKPSEVVPYLEQKKKGPTSMLVSELAARLQCHVIAGYPEALEDGATAAIVNGSAPPSYSAEQVQGVVQPDAMVGYNSAVLAAPSGEIVGNYRKTFLFETDKNWSREGDGFSYFDLPAPLGRVSIGICMDLNPKEFLAPWNAFELATYCVKQKVDILVVPMNWLDPAEQDTADSDSDDEMPSRNDPQAPSESNLNYWAARLTPFHDPTPSYDPSTGTELEPAPTKELVFVACNRVGTEVGTKFVGTSCVMTLRSNPSGIELIECCNRSEERVMVCQVT